jgi:hypothetical protein
MREKLWDNFAAIDRRRRQKEARVATTWRLRYTHKCVSERECVCVRERVGE